MLVLVRVCKNRSCSVARAIPSKGPKGETMSDKKVGRSGGRPITPTQKMEAALSDPGTMNMADTPHDKGKSVLVGQVPGA